MQQPPTERIRPYTAKQRVEARLHALRQDHEQQAALRAKILTDQAKRCRQHRRRKQAECSSSRTDFLRQNRAATAGPAASRKQAQLQHSLSLADLYRGQCLEAAVHRESAVSRELARKAQASLEAIRLRKQRDAAVQEFLQQRIWTAHALDRRGWLILLNVVNGFSSMVEALHTGRARRVAAVRQHAALVLLKFIKWAGRLARCQHAAALIKHFLQASSQLHESPIQRCLRRLKRAVLTFQRAWRSRALCIRAHQQALELLWDRLLVPPANTAERVSAATFLTSSEQPQVTEVQPAVKSALLRAWAENNRAIHVSSVCQYYSSVLMPGLTLYYQYGTTGGAVTTAACMPRAEVRGTDATPMRCNTAS